MHTSELVHSDTSNQSIDEKVYEEGDLYKMTGFSLVGVKLSKSVKM